MVNEKQKYETLIISCWVVLIACFIIKIFGGNWFEIICENQNFINICEWLDGSWVKYIPTTILYVSSVYLIYLAMTNQKIGDDWWLCILLLPMSYIKANFMIVGIIIDIFVWFILPLIKFKFKNWKRVLLGNVLVIAFQLISLGIRNLGIYLTSDSILISIIISIDYYIMIILYYLYCRKEKIKNGMD